MYSDITMTDTTSTLSTTILQSITEPHHTNNDSTPYVSQYMPNNTLSQPHSILQRNQSAIISNSNNTMMAIHTNNILQLPSHLNRQFSTDQLQLSPYNATLPFNSPQLTTIPGLGLSQQYLNQLQSPPISSVVTQPPPQQQQINRNTSRTYSHNMSAPPPMMQHTTTPLRMRYKINPHRLVIKVTKNLMCTYKHINDTYYKTKSVYEPQPNHTRNINNQSVSSTNNLPTSTYDAVHRTGIHNNNCDDKDYNYIVVPNERIGLNQRYIVESSIGKGSFGRVVKCFDRLSTQWVAIKIIKSKSAFHRQAQVEIDVLSTLAPNNDIADKYNIVYMIDQFIHQNHQCIVFELLSLNLYELLRNTRFNGVSLKLVAKFAHQLLQTLWYLNSNIYSTPANKHHHTNKSVLHCDLKPENILLRHMNKSTIKVIDFGSACYNDSKSFTYIQSRFYRAPEILLGLPYSNSIDMFSLGCILMELHTGRPLFDGTCEMDQVIKQYDVLGCPPSNMLFNNSKATKFYDSINDNGTMRYILKSQPSIKSIRKYNNSIRQSLSTKWQDNELYYLFEDFVSQMLIYDPEMRIKPDAALRHPFLQAIASASNTQNNMNNQMNDSTINTTDHQTININNSNNIQIIQQSSTTTQSIVPPIYAASTATTSINGINAPNDTISQRTANKRPLAHLTKHKTWTQSSSTQPVRAIINQPYHTVEHHNINTIDNGFSPKSTGSTACTSISDTHSCDTNALSNNGVQLSPEYTNSTPVVLDNQYMESLNLHNKHTTNNISKSDMLPPTTSHLSSPNTTNNIFTTHREPISIDSAQTSDNDADDSDTDRNSVVQHALAVQSDQSNTFNSTNKKLRTIVTSN